MLTPYICALRRRSIYYIEEVKYPNAGELLRCQMRLDNPRITEGQVLELWEDSVTVGHSEGTARLYPPESILLIHNGEMITTIKYAENEDFDTGHLLTCEDCERRCEGGSKECKWCGSTL